MFLTTFMTAELRGVSVERIATAYADWALGLDAGAPQRRRRLDDGVRKAWTAAMLLDSRSLLGELGCRVEMRVDPNRMSFRFAHRDGSDHAVFWHIAANARRQGDAVVIEHGVARDAPRGYTLAPLSSPSRIVLDLIGQPGVAVVPQELVLEPMQLVEPAAVRHFVHDVLLRAERTLPILVVSCDRGGGPPLVDPKLLGRRVRGLCALATLLTHEATFAFSDALAEAGLSQALRCYHGAIHVYGPTQSIRDDHRLWLGDSLFAIPEQDRVEVVAGRIAGRIAVRDTPDGLFTEIEEHDREQRRSLAERLSTPTLQPPPTNTPSPEYVAQLEGELRETQDALRRSLDSEKEFEDGWTRAEQASRQAQRDRDQAEAELEQERAISQALRDEMREQKARSIAPTNGPLRDAFEATLDGRPTPLHCMLLMRNLYPDRVVVLESAIESAADSKDFKHADRLLKLLYTLATDYHDTLASGKGDTEARKHFGNDCFALMESETTRNNDRAVRERTFVYRGQPLVMWPHLKLGAAETTAETIRVHFEWVAGERKIVIGWCGKHRYRVR